VGILTPKDVINDFFYPTREKALEGVEFQSRMRNIAEDRLNNVDEYFRKHYSEYLELTYWMVLRRNKLESTNGRCQVCGEVATQVHHIKYHLFAETFEDLLSVCNDCHIGLHNLTVDVPMALWMKCWIEQKSI
jgi:5-methylcytosine-specific restriction endonuclease McrA